jgi:hypothetical protein
VTFHNPPDQIQAEPGRAFRVAGVVRRPNGRLENALQIGFGNALPLVRDGQTNAIVRTPDGYVNRSSGRRILDRIAQEVLDRLPQLPRVSGDAAAIFSGIRPAIRDRLSRDIGSTPKAVEDVSCKGGQVHGAPIAVSRRLW